MYITKDLWCLAKKHMSEILNMTLWTILPVILDVIQMTAYGFMLLAILDGRKQSEVLLTIAVVLLTVLLQRGSEHILILRKARCGNKFKSEFRAELFEKLFQLGPAFIDRKQNGELINTLWERVEWIFFYLFYYIPTSVMIVAVSIICACIWILIQPFIAGAMILGGLIVVIAPPLFHKFIKQGSKNEWDDSDAFYSTCLDGLQGIVTLKSFNANERHRAKVDMMSESNRRSTMANLIFTTLNSRLIELIISVCEIIVVVIGVISVSDGTIDTAQMICLFLIMQAWTNGARRILGAWLRGNKGAAAYESSLEILNENCPYSLTDSSHEEKEQKELDDFNSDLEFSDVTFSYSENGSPVLNSVSFKVKQGTQTALVGASGSGKSTIIQLLFGFYKPQLGKIEISGHNLNADNVRQLQQKMTVIWQNCHIFHMSCLDNIKIAKPDATDEEVYSAAKKANIHDMIMRLPDGYSTVIGDGGRNFSGGEKQRIAIARAFLRNTPILILDEATSSLDRKNEMEIQACIRDLCQGKTVVTIAHRLDTIRDADQICVVENGRIAEKGNHQELIDKGSRYAELMCNQDSKGGALYGEKS